jgi:hypothetical protein
MPAMKQLLAAATLTAGIVLADSVPAMVPEPIDVATTAYTG